MEAKDFCAWLNHMKFNDSEAGRRLGISRTTIIKYKSSGAPEHIALACAALAFGLPAWQRPAPTPLGYYEIWWRDNDGRLVRPHRGPNDGIGTTYTFGEVDHAREAIRHAYDVRRAQAEKTAYPARKDYATPAGIPPAKQGRLGIKRIVGGLPVEEIE
ncbi:hypothetical protein L2U69_11890 [Zavarzinia compransoris]|uniref:hypothetical protein n=1 Tax=Zavarzinia marina TaxID=2911065 RepID=UPI001F1C6DB8|nr:hypothetical protein [Zavarzinia marina]MCF4166348.1 hypothetical protein [Zavarzinia marina]